MRELFRRQPRFTPAAEADNAEVPDNLFFKCPQCKELNYGKEFQESLHVCQNCGYHAPLSAHERLNLLLDPQSFQEWDQGIHPEDPLGFVAGPPGKEESYRSKLDSAQQKTSLTEAVVAGQGRINDQPLVVVVCDFGFMGASMGSVYGEKLARAAERAVAQQLPLLTISASGGARMQEGILSLMQMAKTTAALARLGQVRLPHLSLLVDPCYGGVTASYATVADVVMAEPGARIGFAGQSVIEQITRQKLPEGFQRAEFQLEHGMLDLIVHRRELRDTLTTLLRHYQRVQTTPPITHVASQDPEPVEVPS